MNVSEREIERREERQAAGILVEIKDMLIDKESLDDESFQRLVDLLAMYRSAVNDLKSVYPMYPSRQAY